MSGCEFMELGDRDTRGRVSIFYVPLKPRRSVFMNDYVNVHPDLVISDPITDFSASNAHLNHYFGFLACNMTGYSTCGSCCYANWGCPSKLQLVTCADTHFSIYFCFEPEFRDSTVLSVPELPTGDCGAEAVGSIGQGQLHRGVALKLKTVADVSIGDPACDNCSCVPLESSTEAQDWAPFCEWCSHVASIGLIVTTFNNWYRTCLLHNGCNWKTFCRGYSLECVNCDKSLYHCDNCHSDIVVTYVPETTTCVSLVPSFRSIPSPLLYCCSYNTCLIALSSNLKIYFHRLTSCDGFHYNICSCDCDYLNDSQFLLNSKNTCFGCLALSPSVRARLVNTASVGRPRFGEGSPRHINGSKATARRVWGRESDSIWSKMHPGSIADIYFSFKYSVTCISSMAQSLNEMFIPTCCDAMPRGSGLADSGCGSQNINRDFTADFSDYLFIRHSDNFQNSDSNHLLSTEMLTLLEAGVLDENTSDCKLVPQLASNYGFEPVECDYLANKSGKALLIVEPEPVLIVFKNTNSIRRSQRKVRSLYHKSKRTLMGSVLVMLINIMLMVSLVNAEMGKINSAEIACPGFQLRNTPLRDTEKKMASFRRYANCTVIEGDVHLLLSTGDAITHADYHYYSLRYVREIVGSLFVYNIDGLKTLSQLLPELRIIRGQTLVHNYALVLYQNRHLTEVGLPKLIEISRGGVRISQNPQMCFVNSIDWKSILHDKTAHLYVDSNKEEGLCPGPASCVPDTANASHKCHYEEGEQLGADARSYYCWNQTECQRVCPESCLKRNLSCNMDMPEPHCCHEQCLGGCSGPTDRDCVACRYLIHGDRCVTQCPAGTDYVEFLHRKCITSDACRKLEPEKGEFDDIKYFKPINKCCTLICPEGMEENASNHKACDRCDGACKKTCHGLRVFSIADAENLNGCDIIHGALEITLRSNLDSSVVKTLTASLGQIVEVTDFVKIAFSPSFVTLSFLKNLRKIGGHKLWNNKYSLAIFENENLAELWNVTGPDGRSTLQLENGKVQAQNNPNLCIKHIISFIETIGLDNETDSHDVSEYSNGNKAVCAQLKIHLEVLHIEEATVVFKWRAFDTNNMDHRSFLGYQLFHKKVDNRDTVIITENRDACNDSWVVVVLQPQIRGHFLTELKPDTLYAVYLRTLVINSPGALSGISDVIFVRTLYSNPSPVRKVVVRPTSAHSIDLSFEPPSEPNGQITHYKLEWIAIPPLQLSPQNDPCQDDKMTVFEKGYQKKIATLQKPAVDDGALPEYCAAKKIDQTCCQCNADKKSAKGESDIDEPDDMGFNEENLYGQMLLSSGGDGDMNLGYSGSTGPRSMLEVEEKKNFENYIQNFVFERKPIFRGKLIMGSFCVLDGPRGNYPPPSWATPMPKTTPVSAAWRRITMAEPEPPPTVVGGSDATYRAAGLRGSHRSRDAVELIYPRKRPHNSQNGLRHFIPNRRLARTIVGENDIDNGSKKSREKDNEVARTGSGADSGKGSPLPTPTIPVPVPEEATDDPVSLQTLALTFNVSSLHYTITNLSHFYLYEIKIWACQNVSVPKHFCSSAEVRELVMTDAIVEMDRIDEATFEVRRVNSEPRDGGGANNWEISWEPPDTPNGRILRYVVKIEMTKGQINYTKRECVSRTQHRLKRSFDAEGNYSIQVAAVTDYNARSESFEWTSPRYIYVAPEFSFLKLMYICLPILMVVLLVVAASLACWKYRKDGEDAIGGTNPDYIPYNADEWELSRKSIELGKYISSGTFGKVVHGNGRNITSPCGITFGHCAVKSLKKSLYNVEDKNAFLHEAQIWKSYYKCPHIVSLYGVVSDGQPALIVMECMAHGNLRDFLIDKRTNPNAGRAPTYHDVVLMACQIADGMAYLERKQFVHRDLAARNCMLAEDWTCKIGDFGMARELALGEQYYRTKGKRMMPVRWMSPEALQFARFNHKSDVWAYGIVLWEIATFGKQPYYGIPELNDVITYVTSGKTMRIPTDCPELFANLMSLCWQLDNAARPTFHEIMAMTVAELEAGRRERFLEKSYYGNPATTLDAQELETYPEPLPTICPPGPLGTADSGETPTTNNSLEYAFNSSQLTNSAIHAGQTDDKWEVANHADVPIQDVDLARSGVGYGVSTSGDSNLGAPLNLSYQRLNNSSSEADGDRGRTAGSDGVGDLEECLVADDRQRLTPTADFMEAVAFKDYPPPPPSSKSNKRNFGLQNHIMSGKKLSPFRIGRQMAGYGYAPTPLLMDQQPSPYYPGGLHPSGSSRDSSSDSSLGERDKGTHASTSGIHSSGGSTQVDCGTRGHANPGSDRGNTVAAPGGSTTTAGNVDKVVIETEQLSKNCSRTVGNGDVGNTKDTYHVSPVSPRSLNQEKRTTLHDPIVVTFKQPIKNDNRFLGLEAGHNKSSHPANSGTQDKSTVAFNDDDTSPLLPRSKTETEPSNNDRYGPSDPSFNPSCSGQYPAASGVPDSCNSLLQSAKNSLVAAQKADDKLSEDLEGDNPPLISFQTTNQPSPSCFHSPEQFTSQPAAPAPLNYLPGDPVEKDGFSSQPSQLYSYSSYDCDDFKPLQEASPCDGAAVRESGRYSDPASPQGHPHVLADPSSPWSLPSVIPLLSNQQPAPVAKLGDLKRVSTSPFPVSASLSSLSSPGGSKSGTAGKRRKQRKCTAKKFSTPTPARQSVLHSPVLAKSDGGSVIDFGRVDVVPFDNNSSNSPTSNCRMWGKDSINNESANNFGLPAKGSLIGYSPPSQASVPPSATTASFDPQVDLLGMTVPMSPYRSVLPTSNSQFYNQGSMPISHYGHSFPPLVNTNLPGRSIVSSAPMFFAAPQHNALYISPHSAVLQTSPPVNDSGGASRAPHLEYLLQPTLQGPYTVPVMESSNPPVSPLLMASPNPFPMTHFASVAEGPQCDRPTGNYSLAASMPGPYYPNTPIPYGYCPPQVLATNEWGGHQPQLMQPQKNPSLSFAPYHQNHRSFPPSPSVASHQPGFLGYDGGRPPPRRRHQQRSHRHVERPHNGSYLAWNHAAAPVPLEESSQSSSSSTSSLHPSDPHPTPLIPDSPTIRAQTANQEQLLIQPRRPRSSRRKQPATAGVSPTHNHAIGLPAQNYPNDSSGGESDPNVDSDSPLNPTPNLSNEHHPSQFGGIECGMESLAGVILPSLDPTANLKRSYQGSRGATDATDDDDDDDYDIDLGCPKSLGFSARPDSSTSSRSRDGSSKGYIVRPSRGSMALVASTIPTSQQLPGPVCSNNRRHPIHHSAMTKSHTVPPLIPLPPVAGSGFPPTVHNYGAIPGSLISSPAGLSATSNLPLVTPCPPATNPSSGISDVASSGLICWDDLSKTNHSHSLSSESSPAVPTALGAAQGGCEELDCRDPPTKGLTYSVSVGGLPAMGAYNRQLSYPQPRTQQPTDEDGTGVMGMDKNYPAPLPKLGGIHTNGSIITMNGITPSVVSAHPL